MDDYFVIEGLEKIIEFYEQILIMNNLLNNSNTFNKLYPNY